MAQSSIFATEKRNVLPRAKLISKDMWNSKTGSLSKASSDGWATPHYTWRHGGVPVSKLETTAPKMESFSKWESLESKEHEPTLMEFETAWPLGEGSGMSSTWAAPTKGQEWPRLFSPIESRSAVDHREWFGSGEQPALASLAVPTLRRQKAELGPTTFTHTLEPSGGTVMMDTESAFSTTSGQKI